MATTPVPNPDQDLTAANTMAAISSAPITPVFPEPEPIPDLSSPMPTLGGIPSLGGTEGESVEEMIARLQRYSTAGKPQHGGTGIYPASEVTSERYPFMLPGANNEDLYGASQKWYSKAFNGVSKGVVLTGTTFLNSTAGLIDGLFEWGVTGKFSSMWDNITTQAMDDVNSTLENTLPNYYTARETNAAWYSPQSLLTANFIFDKFVKNLGFVAGAILAGGTYSSILKGIGLGAELGAAGRMAQAVEASEQAMLSGEGIGGLVNRLRGVVGTSNFLDKTNQVLTAGLATTGEAAMEALGAANEYRSNAIQTYRDEHNGEMPDAIALGQIDKEAETVGNSAMQLNMALLTATNYIQFPKVLNASWSAAKSVDNAIAKNVAINDAGRWAVKEGPKTWFGKGLSFAKRLPFSGSEAFEEVSQYAIEHGTQNYWNKKYRGEDADFLTDLVGEGYHEALNSKEGMESLLLGGLSGGIIEAVRGRGQRKAELARASMAAADVNSRRSVPSILNNTIAQDRIDSLNRSTTLGEQLKVAIRKGDEKLSRDLMYDDVHNTLSTRIKYGAYEQVVDEIKRHQQLASTPQGFTQLQERGVANATDTRESFLARTNYLLDEAKSIKNLHEGLTLKYSGILNEKGQPKYSPTVISKMVYAASKIKNIDERAQVLTNELTALGIDPTLAIEEAFTKGDTSILEKLLSSATKLTPEQLDDAKNKLIDLTELYVDRKTYVEDYRRIKDFPEKNGDPLTFDTYDHSIPKGTKPGEPSNPNPDEDETDEEGESTDTIKKPKAVKLTELEDGKRYYISSQGRNVDSFVVLAKNADGSVTFKDIKTGKIVTMAEADLLKMSLVPFGAAGTKTEEFFLRHNTDVYEMDLRGTTVQGQLTFDPDNNILSFSYADPTTGSLLDIELSDYEFTLQTGFTSPLLRNLSSPVLTEEDEAALQAMAIEQRDGGVNTLVRRRDKLNQGIEVILTRLADNHKDTTKLRETISSIQEKLNEGTLSPKDLSKLLKTKEKLEADLAILEADKARYDLYLDSLLALQRDVATYPADTQELIKVLNSRVEELEKNSAQLNSTISSLKKALRTVNNLITKALNAIRKAFDRFNKIHPDRLTLEDTELGFALATIPQAGYAEFLQEPASYGADLQALTEAVEGLKTDKLNPSRVEKERINQDLQEAESQLQKVEAELDMIEIFLSSFQKELEEAEAKRLRAEQKLNDPEFQAALDIAQQEAEVSNGIAILSPEEALLEEQAFDEKAAKEANEEVARKPLRRLFGSTTQTTEADNQAHQGFLAIIDKHPNRDNIRRVAVSYNNQEAAGLKGLIPDSHPYSPVSIAKDPKKKGLEVIYVVYQEKDAKTGTIYYLDSKGERIENPQENIDKVVRGTLTSSGLTWGPKYKGVRYSKGSAEEAKEFSERWELVRNWITSSIKKIPSHKFFVSRGISVKGKAKQPITKALISETDLFSPVVKVATRDTFIHQDEAVKVAPGTVMIQNGSTLEHANSRNLTEREVNLILKLMVEYARRAEKVTEEDGTTRQGTLDPQINRYLWGVLYFQTPYELVKGEWVKHPVSRNQFYLRGGKLYLGASEEGLLFDADVLSDPTQNVILRNFIRQAYHNVNKQFVDKNNEYEEIIDVQNGELIVRKWPTYQHYLVSDVYPDGSSRNINDIPLTTKVVQGDNIKNRYSYSTALMNTPDIPKAQPKQPPTPPPGPAPTQTPPPAGKTVTYTKAIGDPANPTTVTYTLTDGKATIVGDLSTMEPANTKLRAYYENNMLETVNADLVSKGQTPVADYNSLPSSVKYSETEMENMVLAGLEKRLQDALDAEASRTPYEVFIDTGMVDDATLRVLADKRKAGEPFTPEEQAMASGELPIAEKTRTGLSYWNQVIDSMIALTPTGTGLVPMPVEKNGKWQVYHDPLNNKALDMYLATVGNRHGNTQDFVPDLYEFPTEAQALAFVKEVNAQLSGATIGEATAEYLDRINPLDNRQKVKLVDLIRSGAITFTEENGEIC